MSSNLIVNNIEVGAGATIYTAASNQLAFGTNGSEKVRITSAGLVGIGTNNPNEDLHIASNSPYIKLQDYDNNRSWRIKGTAWFAIEDITAGTDRLRISSTGNVSIGDNVTPDTLLHIQGDQPKLRIESTNALSASAGTEEIARIEFEATKGSNLNVAASMRVRQDGTWSTVDDWFSPTAIEFYTQDQSGTEITIPRLTIASSGQIGVGVAAPTFAAINSITANSARGIEIHKDGTDTGSAIKLAGDNGSGTKSYSQLGYSGANATSHWANYNTGGTKTGEIVIGSTGKVGIGTDVPDYGLHVYGPGDILIEDSGNGSAHLRLRSANGGSDVSNWKLKTSSNNYFYIENDTVGGAAQFTIDSSGDVDVRGNIKSNNLPGNNILHNGEMAIWQRGTTSIYTSQNKYLVDRWKILSVTDGNGAIHQHTNVPTVAQTGGSKFAHSLRVNCTTADTSLANNQYINLSQRIEGQDLRHLGFGQAGTRYATLSFWQRSNSGTYHVSFRNSAYNRYYIAAYTAANHTWEKHELTIPIDTSGTWATNNSVGLDITWSLGGGSWYNDGTVGSWSSGSKHSASSQKNFFDSTSNDFYITGVQFEKGSIATPFEHKSYGEDLRHCQRYFYRAAEGASKALGLGVNYTASEMHCAITFPVTMRATPTLSAASGTNYYEFIRNGAADWFNSFALGNRTTNKIGEIYNQSEISGTVGHGGYVRTDNAAVYVDFVSEL